MSDDIAAMGQAIGPEILGRVQALYDSEQRALAARFPATALDLPYGDHPRHRLDLYRAEGAAFPAPILVFFHGGGFLKGDKGGATEWPNANVGRMAAEAGFLGVVPNYRLAPDHPWPAGSEDVAAVVAWLQTSAASHGGDPTRIILAGTSAGAVHVAGYLKLSGAAAIRSAILLSGLYGYTPLDDRDTLYYGDPADYPDRMPRDAVASADLPLFIACAQHDPDRFRQEFAALAHDRSARPGVITRSIVVADHNHYSLSMHLGATDRRLADAICAFARQTTN